MMSKQISLSKSFFLLFLITLCYSSSHATTHRKLSNLRSPTEIKKSSDVFGHMLPKNIPIPPSGPSCRSSPGSPPSCLVPTPTPP